MRLVRRSSICLSAILSLACSHAFAQDDPAEAARTAIRDSTRHFVAAFNAGDTRAMTALWTENGDFVGENGKKILFREQLAARAKAELPEDVKEGDLVRPSLGMTVDGVRFPTPRVATVDGTSIFRTHPGAPAVHSRYTATWVLNDGDKWLLDSVRENHVPAGSHHAHLMDLEWMIGEWTANGNSPLVETTLKWSADGNYLERTFHSRLPGRGDRVGAQRIGWDPKREQFRSWTFSSDGSFTQALWTATENGWNAETSGVTADGKSTGSITKINRIDDNTMEWESVEATVEGQAMPDLKLRLIRKPAK